jgi:hypothetical protein
MLLTRLRGEILKASVALRNSPQRSIQSKPAPKIETDSCGIPLKPTWSVHDLLSSYPNPTITPATFRRLHELSALIPPEEGTPEYESLKWELEELIRLVEAVKLVDVSGVDGECVPDGRIWAEGAGWSLEAETNGEDACASGPALLRHASETSNGMYVVDADRRSNS